MNILITGGTGFLGSHIARQLSNSKNNIKIIARGFKKDYLTRDELMRFDFTQCDMRNKESLKMALSADIDLVIHCAGIVEIQTDGRCAESLIETNVAATTNLLEAMIGKGIKRLLFTSSMTVYGIKNDIPAKEEGLLESIHFYGLSKKWTEEAIINYAQHGLIKAIILRYPGFYGYPRCSGYIYNTIKRLLKNEDFTIDTKGLEFWETINIDDAAEITKKILDVWEWKKNYIIMNCSYGEEIDFVSTAFKIKEIINSKSSIEVKKPVDYIRFYLDNSKLRNLIHFNYSFEKSLKHFLENYKKWLQE